MGKIIDTVTSVDGYMRQKGKAAEAIEPKTSKLPKLEVPLAKEISEEAKLLKQMATMQKENLKQDKEASKKKSTQERDEKGRFAKKDNSVIDRFAGVRNAYNNAKEINKGDHDAVMKSQMRDGSGEQIKILNKISHTADEILKKLMGGEKKGGGGFLGGLMSLLGTGLKSMLGKLLAGLLGGLTLKSLLGKVLKGGVSGIGKLLKGGASLVGKAASTVGKVIGAGVGGIAKVAGKLATMTVAAGGVGAAAKGGLKAVGKVLKGGVAGIGGMAAVSGTGIGKVVGKIGAMTAGGVGAVAKGGLKTIGKAIPGVGLALGIGFGAQRAMKGDYLGALGEVTSGIVGLLPGLGTAASVAISAGLIARDAAKANEVSTTESIGLAAKAGLMASEVGKTSMGMAAKAALVAFTGIGGAALGLTLATGTFSSTISNLSATLTAAISGFGKKIADMAKNGLNSFKSFLGLGSGEPTPDEVKSGQPPKKAPNSPQTQSKLSMAWESVTGVVSDYGSAINKGFQKTDLAHRMNGNTNAAQTSASAVTSKAADKQYNIEKAAGKTALSTDAKTGAIRIATGAIDAGARAAGETNGITLASGAHVDGMNPDFMNAFYAMAGEHYQQTKKKIVVNSAYRTNAEQAKLHKDDPKKAAPPGNSMHERGLAIDMNTPDAERLIKLGLMDKYGFFRPVKESWHVEMKATASTRVAITKGWKPGQTEPGTPQTGGALAPGPAGKAPATAPVVAAQPAGKAPATVAPPGLTGRALSEWKRSNANKQVAAQTAPIVATASANSQPTAATKTVQNVAPVVAAQTAPNNQPVAIVPTVAAKVKGNNGKGSSTDATQMAVYNAYKKAGATDAQAMALTAHVARENDYNHKDMFGSHNDAANGKANIGMHSWQEKNAGGRKTKLLEGAKKEGLLNPDGTFKPGQASIDYQAKFALGEINANPTWKKEFAAAANDPQKALLVGDKFEGWDKAGKNIGKDGAQKAMAKQQNALNNLQSNLGKGKTDATLSFTDAVTGGGADKTGESPGFLGVRHEAYSDKTPPHIEAARKSIAGKRSGQKALSELHSGFRTNSFTNTGENNLSRGSNLKNGLSPSLSPDTTNNEVLSQHAQKSNAELHRLNRKSVDVHVSGQHAAGGHSGGAGGQGKHGSTSGISMGMGVRNNDSIIREVAIRMMKDSM